MRVLFSSTSGTGHVQPMLPLAVRMRERGDEVLWATGEDGCQWVGAAGIDAVVLGLSTGQRMGEYLRRWPEAATLTGETRAAHMFPRLFGAVSAPAAFPALLALATQWRPDMIVSEAADFAAPVVAAALGVPQVTHGFGLVIPADRVQQGADFAAPLWGEVGREPRPFGGCYDHLYVDIYPPSLQPDDLAHIGRIQRRRPASHTAGGTEVPSDVRALLDDPRPLVYLTFGTVFNVTPTFAAAVDGLRELDDVVAVVTVGPEGDPRAFGALPDHMAVSRYVSQHELFPHTAVVASHAGSGTFLGALSVSIPQVCLPQAADQFRNASACVAAGAGIGLVGDQATPDAIATALATVLTDPRYREGAERVAAEISSMPTLDDTVDAITSLAGARR